MKKLKTEFYKKHKIDFYETSLNNEYFGKEKWIAVKINNELISRAGFKTKMDAFENIKLLIDDKHHDKIRQEVFNEKMNKNLMR